MYLQYICNLFLNHFFFRKRKKKHENRTLFTLWTRLVHHACVGNVKFSGVKDKMMIIGRFVRREYFTLKSPCPLEAFFAIPMWKKSLESPVYVTRNTILA